MQCGILRDENERLRSLNAELVAALSETLEAAEDCNDRRWHEAWGTEITEAHAVLAKAKGGES